MANDLYIPLRSDVGIQRDGTQFDSTLHNSGSWVRFYRGRPQKIGGWQLIANGTTEIIRSTYDYEGVGFVYLYFGRPSSLSFMQAFYPSLVTSPPSTCTPDDFIPDENNNWIFDSVAYVPEGEDEETLYVVASCCPNLTDIGSTTERPVYYGVLGEDGPFQPMTDGIGGDPITTSGGVVVMSTFVIVYGENGILRWNDGADFTTWPEENELQAGTSKYIFSLPVRAGSNPVNLFWSLDGVISVTLSATPETPDFNYSYVASRTTVMSPKSIVSFEPNVYWVGNDCFWMWNGSVQELPNTINKKWFFENINPNQTGKTFAYADTQWNEVWFVFCKGTATEPNHAVVYCVDTQNWYDTDQINRGSGVPSSSVFRKPILTSSVPVTSGGNEIYPIYAHEIGSDAIEFGVTKPIVSYIESKNYNLWAENPAAKVLALDSVILDVQQTGNMYFYVKYYGYPNSTMRQTENFDFTNSDEFKTVRIKGSIFSIVFVSNVVGGDYVMGNTMMYLNIPDDQRIGPAT